MTFEINNKESTNLTNQEVCVISYNSRGFSDIKQSCIRTLLSDNVVGNKIPIVCNQEHFILRSILYKILNALPGCHIILKPAVKNDLDKGRPKGGLFIAVPDYLKSLVTDVSPEYWRVQAAVISTEKSKTLLINSYFPCDSGRLGGANIDEAVEVCEVIKKVILENKCEAIIWCGDVNTDFRRNTGHVELVSDFTNELQLHRVWQNFEVDFTRVCSLVDDNVQTSIIDHFFVSQVLKVEIVDAGVIHSVENSSDHSPIYCTFRPFNITIDVAETVAPIQKPSWKKASLSEKETYTFCLDEKLSHISVPAQVLECVDVNCSDKEHCDLVDKLTIEVLETVQVVAEETLPLTSVSNSSKVLNTIPGWNDIVKPYRENAIFWHQIWTSCGKPLNCEVHNLMKRTRNVYHYQVKSNCDLFKVINELRKTKPVVANSIDGVTENIPEHFRHIYSSLYNSVDDAENMVKVSAEVCERISGAELREVNKVTPEIVKKAAESSDLGEVIQFTTSLLIASK